MGKLAMEIGKVIVLTVIIVAIISSLIWYLVTQRNQYNKGYKQGQIDCQGKVIRDIDSIIKGDSNTIREITLSQDSVIVRGDSNSVIIVN